MAFGSKYYGMMKMMNNDIQKIWREKAEISLLKKTMATLKHGLIMFGVCFSSSG